MASCWEILELEPTTDEREIKRAYAKRLKIVNPEDDAEGFKELRWAYDRARQEAPYVGQNWDDEDDDWDEEEGEDASPASVQLVYSNDRDSGHADPAFTPSDDDIFSRLTPEELSRKVQPVNTSEEEDDSWDRLNEDDLRETPKFRQAQPAPQLDQSPDVEQFNRLLREIGQQLSETVKADDTIHAKFKQLLALPVYDQFDSLEDYETDVAQLLSYNLPASSSLINEAAKRFNWKKRVENDWREEQSLTSWLLDQTHLTDGIDALGEKPAGRALLEEPKSWQLHLRCMATGFAEKVQKNIALLESDYPGFEHHVNAEAMSWWQRYFSRPQIGPWLFWGALVPGFISLLFALMAWPWQKNNAGNYPGSVQWSAIFGAIIVINAVIRIPAYFYRMRSHLLPKTSLLLTLAPMLLIHAMIALYILSITGVILPGDGELSTLSDTERAMVVRHEAIAIAVSFFAVCMSCWSWRFLPLAKNTGQFFSIIFSVGTIGTLVLGWPWIAGLLNATDGELTDADKASLLIMLVMLAFCHGMTRWELVNTHLGLEHPNRRVVAILSGFGLTVLAAVLTLTHFQTTLYHCLSAIFIGLPFITNTLVSTLEREKLIQISARIGIFGLIVFASALRTMKDGTTQITLTSLFAIMAIAVLVTNFSFLKARFTRSENSA
jgi:hypothetical protein